MHTTQNLVDSQGNVVGDVQVTIVGNSVIVTIVAAPNVVLEEVYMYVGTEGVPLNSNGTVNIPAFPYVATNVNGSSSSVSYNTTVCIVAWERVSHLISMLLMNTHPVVECFEYGLCEPH